MKKGIILSAIALCLLALPGKAQEPVRSVEFEMGFGSGAAIWLGKSCASLEFKMELRCNLPHPHWDLGMYFAVAEAVDGIQYDKANDLYLFEVTTYMLPVIDYNWRRGKKISYFVWQISHHAPRRRGIFQPPAPDCRLQMEHPRLIQLSELQCRFCIRRWEKESHRA